MTRIAAATLAALTFGACSPPQTAAGPAPEAPLQAVAAQEMHVAPEPVNGWREYPLRDGVISIQEDGKWRSDVIHIPVKAGEDLEYKLEMKKGQGVVYTITYGSLEHPGLMEVEFHGHTAKDAAGIGDLMFYSKTGGAAQSGVFTAPWDGIHGWYLKNDSGKNVSVRLDIAGFYNLQD